MSAVHRGGQLGVRLGGRFRGLRPGRRRFSEYWPGPFGYRVPVIKAHAHCGMMTSRGTRTANEDRLKAGILDGLRGDGTAAAAAEAAPFYFGIFDGHGGAECAAFLEDRLHEQIEQVGVDEVQTVVDGWRSVGGYFKRFHPAVLDDVHGTGALTIPQRLHLAFLKTDWIWRAQHPDSIAGACASIAVVFSADNTRPFWDTPACKIHVAHVGDTRVLACSSGAGLAIPLTHNHHPSSPAETARLRRYAYGFATDSFGEERFGFLANTRAFGDIPMKKLGVTAEPDITTVISGEGKDELAFIVLCSDGITSVLSDQEIVDTIKAGADPRDAAASLVETAEMLGTDDNSTCMVVRLSGWHKAMPDLTKHLRAFRLKEIQEAGLRRQ